MSRRCRFFRVLRGWERCRPAFRITISRWRFTTRRAANLLEVVILVTAEGAQIVIHAMPMRDKYARLLEP